MEYGAALLSFRWNLKKEILDATVEGDYAAQAQAREA